MVKRYIKLCLVVVILQFSTVKASAQIGSVIGIASKYASLLKSNQNNIIYASESLEEIKDDHEKIAILPFQAQIEYTKPPEYDVEEAQAQFENQQMIGKMLQEQFWDVFDNNRSDVFLQDIRITNKILQDIGYFANPEQFPPSYLAKLLEVDAVLICTYDIKVDNEKTGWQSFSKAFTSFAVSNLKGMVPGLEALSFVKNPQAIIDIVTKPKEFFDKLKSGDLSALASIANTMLPDGNISKVANLAAKNSKTIVNVAKGNTQNLFSDIISNNLEVIGKDLKINPQVMTMIKKNAGSVEKVMAGKTKGLIFDIVNNNIADVTSKYVSDQNNLLSQVISNNTTTLAKLAQGETKGLLSEIISNNLNQVSNLTGIENANQYT